MQINEGGYVKDPSDSGGETNFGISDKADGVIDGKYKGIPIKDITAEKAAQIFETDYFSQIPKVDDEEYQYHLYDHAINAGVSSALKIYKGSKDTLKPAETAKLLRQTFYKSIATGKNAKFLNGWLKRTEYKS